MITIKQVKKEVEVNEVETVKCDLCNNKMKLTETFQIEIFGPSDVALIGEICSDCFNLKLKGIFRDKY